MKRFLVLVIAVLAVGVFAISQMDYSTELSSVRTTGARRTVRPKQQAEPTKKQEVSAELQADRLAFIQKMIKNDIFAKVEPGYSVPKVWVGSQFYLATFDEKQSFISVVYAYYFPDGGGIGDVVQLKSNMTGKVIGSFSRGQGGLRLK